MSNIPPFPEERGSSSDQSQTGGEKPEFKRPKFILIDDRQGESRYTNTQAEAETSFSDPKEFLQTEKGVEPPSNALALRLICLLGLVFSLIFGLGIFLWSIVSTFFATCSLFQYQDLNQRARALWKLCANTCIASFGFALGLISPTLGLGLLALYFVLATDLVKDDLLRKVIRNSFNRL